MRSDLLLDAMGEIRDDLIQASEKAGRPARRRWLRWAAAAACLGLIAAGAVRYMRQPPRSPVEKLLASYGSYNADTVVRYSFVQVETRVAWYEMVCGEVPADALGAVYWQGTDTWYYPADCGNLKYLIRETGGGERSLWKFGHFLVDGEANETLEAFPDADYSTYTYGDVYRLIYGVESAGDLWGLTASPSNANNTDLGRKIQKEVGTHTYRDRDTLQAFYDATVDVVCLGACDSYDVPYRFTYSFSTEETDKLTSGESTYGTRYLTVTLQDGTTIDAWKYDALLGCFYEFGGIYTVPLEAETVAELNRIFGIE